MFAWCRENDEQERKEDGSALQPEEHTVDPDSSFCAGSTLVECEIVVFTETVQRGENGQRKADTDALDPVVQRSAIARFFFRQCTKAIVQRRHIGKCRADVSYRENADDGR